MKLSLGCKYFTTRCNVLQLLALLYNTLSYNMLYSPDDGLFKGRNF